MHSRPPAVIENMVRLLVPPASREHVMGDLSERYRSPRQYLMDAFQSLPLIIASQVRRTSNPGRLGVVAVTMAEVRGFEAASRRATRIEIGAAFALVAGCIASLWAMRPTPLGEAFNAITAGGALFVVWFLHRHARITPVAEGLEFAQSVTSYRRNLERQLQRAHTVIWWYWLPLSVGPAVLLFGVAYQQANPWPVVFKGLTGFAVICGLILYMYQSSEQKLRRRIAQLGEITQKP